MEVQKKSFDGHRHGRDKQDVALAHKDGRARCLFCFPFEEVSWPRKSTWKESMQRLKVPNQRTPPVWPIVLQIGSLLVTNVA